MMAIYIQLLRGLQLELHYELELTLHSNCVAILEYYYELVDQELLVKEVLVILRTPEPNPGAIDFDYAAQRRLISKVRRFASAIRKVRYRILRFWRRNSATCSICASHLRMD